MGEEEERTLREENSSLKEQLSMLEKQLESLTKDLDELRASSRVGGQLEKAPVECLKCPGYEDQLKAMKEAFDADVDALGKLSEGLDGELKKNVDTIASLEDKLLKSQNDFSVSEAARASLLVEKQSLEHRQADLETSNLAETAALKDKIYKIESNFYRFQDASSLSFPRGDVDGEEKIAMIDHSRPYTAPSVVHEGLKRSTGSLRIRDYSVLVDASASMRLVDRGAYGRTRWDLARDALELLVPQVVERDEDGITLYFFSAGYQKFKHVKSVEDVKWNFAQTQPKGGTMLVEALEDAIIPDNQGRPETILIITDGAPHKRGAVEQVIADASASIKNEDDLRIVFVQVGQDGGATHWLSRLKERLDCKYDILEVISRDQLSRKGVPFAQWVSRSVMPDLGN